MTPTLLFGGSFDPPHLAHLQIPLAILQEGLAAEVWYVPAKQHPHLKPLSPEKDRLAMLQLMLPPDEPRLQIKTWELEQKTVSFSINTLQALSKKYPDRHFSWLIGSDNLAKFSTWHAAAEILDAFGVVVYPRKGYPIEPLLPGMTLLKDVPESDISSREVKRRIEAGQPFEHLVSPGVEEYIQTHTVYHRQG